MNIVVLTGSPRKKGNSATLAARFVEKAESLGAETRTFHLNNLSIKGCQACGGCKTKKDHCVVKDDMSDVLDAVRRCDALVLATPVYFGDVSAQMKMFIDRTYSYLVPDFLTNPNLSRLEPGKRLVFIQTQAQENEDLFSDIYPKYEMFLNMMGFKDNILIRACGVSEAGETAAIPELLEQADAAAASVMKS